MRFHVLLLGALALTACQTAPEPTPTLPTASPSRTAPPTTPPDPSFSGEHHEIYQTVRNFRDAFDEWGQNPTPEFGEVIQYTTDNAQTDIANLMEERLSLGDVVEGKPTYRSWSIDPPEELPDGTRQATVTFCQDSRSAVLILKEGTRSPRELLYWEIYTVQQQRNNTWLVSTIRNEETESC